MKLLLVIWGLTLTLGTYDSKIVRNKPSTINRKEFNKSIEKIKDGKHNRKIYR